MTPRRPASVVLASRLLDAGLAAAAATILGNDGPDPYPPAGVAAALGASR